MLLFFDLVSSCNHIYIDFKNYDIQKIYKLKILTLFFLFLFFKFYRSAFGRHVALKF